MWSQQATVGLQNDKSPSHTLQNDEFSNVCAGAHVSVSVGRLGLQEFLEDFGEMMEKWINMGLLLMDLFALVWIESRLALYKMTLGFRGGHRDVDPYLKPLHFVVTALQHPKAPRTFQGPFL